MKNDIKILNEMIRTLVLGEKVDFIEEILKEIGEDFTRFDIANLLFGYKELVYEDGEYALVKREYDEYKGYLINLEKQFSFEKLLEIYNDLAEVFIILEEEERVEPKFLFLSFVYEREETVKSLRTYLYILEHFNELISLNDEYNINTIRETLTYIEEIAHDKKGFINDLKEKKLKRHAEAFRNLKSEIKNYTIFKEQENH